MKNYFILLLIGVISFFLSSCVTRNSEDIYPDFFITNNSMIDNVKDYVIEYPSINKREIDERILEEVNNLIIRIEENIKVKTIRINYDTFVSYPYFSVYFNIDVLKQNSERVNFYHTFNFDTKENKKIYLKKESIEKRFMSLINDRLKEYNLSFSLYDCLGLNYVIYNNYIRFFLIDEINNNENLSFDFALKDHDIVYLTDGKNEKNKTVVLTFDDGPSTKTNELIDLLVEQNVPAAFFLLGENVIRYPEQVELLHKYNFEIGNHSFTHPEFTKLNESEILFEINHTQNLIYNLIGIYPKIFRFPYSSHNESILEKLNILPIFWNVDSLDYKLIKKDKIIEHVLNNLNDNAIILFHDGFYLDIEMIKELIIILKDKGYTFTTIFEFFSFNLKENIVYNKIYR